MSFREIPDTSKSESARLSPPSKEPPLTKQAAIANEYADADDEQLARRLHDRSVFARGPHATEWDKVDAVYRERRIAQAHDLRVLGAIQPINLFYGNEPPL